MLSQIISRLDTQVAALKQVGGAAELGAVGNGVVVTPAAFVVLLAERASGNAVENGVEQRIEVRFGVIYAVRNVQDARGAAAQGELQTLREAGFTALLGWQPEAGYDPALCHAGRLLKLENLVLWWQDEFTTAFYRRA